MKSLLFTDQNDVGPIVTQNMGSEITGMGIPGADSYHNSSCHSDVKLAIWVRCDYD